ncbi:sterol 3-beta-glucosyltransferase [Acrasis kona]|uniref:Sterol 3-beta-glucosyltransferase n=1 Tax=Acrasis kona TaxID=1008807 RepID=A0AAW2ZF72_9EUKA
MLKSLIRPAHTIRSFSVCARRLGVKGSPENSQTGYGNHPKNEEMLKDQKDNKDQPKKEEKKEGTEKK